MDTKWNNIAELPGAAEAAAPPKRTFKAVTGFIAFVLGVSLVLGSLSSAVGRWAWQRVSDCEEWWKDDWQETAAFRAAVSQYLKEFLTLGAGGPLEWYSEDTVLQVEDGSGLSFGWWEVDTAMSEASYTSVPDDYEDPTDSNPDYWYESDKNVLYMVTNLSTDTRYSNVDEGRSLYQLPAGYNFLLIFRDGKVRIDKDGSTIDVYGDGIYDEDDPWFVPGYDNFPAGDSVEDVSVYMAVRETPVRYYTRDYSSGGYQENCRMYYLLQGLLESRAFYLRQAILLGAGILLLGLGWVLRQERHLVERKLASWTNHVCTEIRLLAVLLPLAGLLLPLIVHLQYNYYTLLEIWFEGMTSYSAYFLARELASCLENTFALLVLVWVLWLIYNDHRYHPKARRSLLRKLFRSLRAKELKLPVQKRLARNSIMGLAVRGLLLVATLPFLLAFAREALYYSYTFSWAHVAAALLSLLDLAVLLSIFHVWHSRRLARDIGLLVGQVEAIRNGDLSTPLELPEDADLRQTADALNDIQAGMHKALQEQTRSERMKVELISNVSHDLKTPLTSILSYAELLRQEELPPAAADYARILDEKAHRLSAMVQDVFEVSKAAADQLPVNPERLDLAKLLRQTLADMDDTIQASSLTFKLELPDGPVMIVADGKRLYRVFQNLIQNVLQYALDGSRVYLTLQTVESRAEVSLRNTSREELPAGVDFTARFVRGDDSRTDGGSGLGLSIAKSFTEACGGEFRIETLADLFTAVVSFPLAK